MQASTQLQPQPSISMGPQRKVFDTIYGFISFPKLVWEFIDTPHVQRLRNIKQLGCLFWVFPGAMHSRFQHSLGTGHLAQKYITTLIEKHRDPTINPQVYASYYSQDQSSKYKTTIEQAIFIVTLAGILHDVGHGPFSHLFDSKVVKKVGDTDWEHQIASLCLIDAIYEHVIGEKNPEAQKEEIQWLKSTKDRVKALIIGKITKAQYQPGPTKEDPYVKVGYKEVKNLQKGFNQIFKDQIGTRAWQFELISNRLTGIDVDKLDYFRRDAFYVGAKNIYIDHELLMNETLILKSEDTSKHLDEGWCQKSQAHRLCYPSKYFDKVFDIYYSRYKLYKTYYLNLKSNGVDFMMAEILSESEPHFKFKETCKQLLDGDCKKYIRLTDSIVEKIEDEYERAQGIPQGQLTDEQKGIIRAGRTLKKLKRRQIFDFVQEYQKSFPFDKIGYFQKVKQPLKEKLKQQMNIFGNIVLNQAEIGFGMKDKDPFAECRFYDKTKPVKRMQAFNQKYFSMLKPNGIIEISIRLYFKDRSKQPTEQQKQRYEYIEREVGEAIRAIDKEFVHGQSGSYTNRSQSAPGIPVNENGREAIRENIRNDLKEDKGDFGQ